MALWLHSWISANLAHVAPGVAEGEIAGHIKSIFALSDESSGVGLALFDAEARYLGVNRHLAHLNGIPVHEHCSRSIHEVAPEIGPTLKRLIERTLQTVSPITGIQFSARVPFGCGPIRHWRVSFFPVDLGRGGLGVAHTVVETTECTCIESALTDLGLHILKPDDGESLTSREAEVLTLIGQGRTTKEIAAVLRISPETVGNHRKQICRKLQLHSTAEIVSYAARGFRTSAVQIS